MSVTKTQHVVLNLFSKTKMPVEKMKESLEKETGSGKIIHVMLSALAKKGFVLITNDNDLKMAEITKEGKAMAKTEQPDEAPKKEPKPKYVPLYAEEELNGMKKKKRKKAQKKELAAQTAFISEHGAIKSTPTPSTNPSNYQDTIKHGKYQVKTGKPSATKAAQDLFDQIVTKDVLVTQADFIKGCEEHEINKGSARSVWYKMIKIHDIQKEVIQSAPNEPTEKAGKPAKKKKGKKSKKA